MLFVHADAGGCCYRLQWQEANCMLLCSQAVTKVPAAA
jgi:hypothetical protein